MVRAFKITFLILIPLFPAWALTSLPQQDIDEDTHWTRDGSPYVIYGDLVIRNGAVLSIDAGVEVRFAKVSGDGGYEDGAELVIRSGSLVASGRKGSPVIFTAHTANPEPGYWGGIISENNLFVLEHTDIRYAKNGLRLRDLSSLVSGETSTLYLEISNCSDSGILIDGGYANVYHATLRDNERAGIETKAGFCNVIVNWSDIYDNGLYNFENRSSNNVNATDCWWGTTVEALIEMRIYDKNDNPGVGEVDYTPYLSGSFKDVGSTPQYSWGTIKSLFFSDHGNGPG